MSEKVLSTSTWVFGRYAWCNTFVIFSDEVADNMCQTERKPSQSNDDRMTLRLRRQKQDLAALFVMDRYPNELIDDLPIILLSVSISIRHRGQLQSLLLFFKISKLRFLSKSRLVFCIEIVKR